MQDEGIGPSVVAVDNRDALERKGKPRFCIRGAFYMGVNPVVMVQIIKVEVPGRLVTSFCLQTGKRSDLETQTSAEPDRIETEPGVVKFGLTDGGSCIIRDAKVSTIKLTIGEQGDAADYIVIDFRARHRQV